MEWKVFDDYSGCNDNYIAFSLISYSRAQDDDVSVEQGNHLGWVLRKLNHAVLSRTLDEGPPLLEESASADETDKVLNNYLVNAWDI